MSVDGARMCARQFRRRPCTTSSVFPIWDHAVICYSSSISPCPRVCRRGQGHVCVSINRHSRPETAHGEKGPRQIHLSHEDASLERQIIVSIALKLSGICLKAIRKWVQCTGCRRTVAPETSPCRTQHPSAPMPPPKRRSWPAAIGKPKRKVLLE